jgi:hypothetical protein
MTTFARIAAAASMACIAALTTPGAVAQNADPNKPIRVPNALVI